MTTKQEAITKLNVVAAELIGLGLLSATDSHYLLTVAERVQHKLVREERLKRRAAMRSTHTA